MSRRLLLTTTALTLTALTPACGNAPPPADPSAPQGSPLDCPAPIGTIRAENCAEIADDFGAFSTGGALKLAGTARDAEARIDAIRAADALAAAIKQERVKLCEDYNKCQVSPQDHAAKDKVLAGAMRALIDLWDKRQFSRADQIASFRASVRDLDARLHGGDLAPAAASAPTRLRPEDALAQTAAPGLSFNTESGAITITAQGPGPHDALESRPDAMPLRAGHHIRIKITGTYTPATPPLVKPGDELTAKIKYRAQSAGDLYLALRSLEEPDAEPTETWRLAPGDKGERTAKLTADPNASGFYLALGGSAAALVDDIELLRGDKPIAAARAEAPSETGVKTDCATTASSPLAGAKSFDCKAGQGDRLTLASPEAHLVLAIRSPSGERAALRTLSLEGGRSLDATLPEDAKLVVRLVGPGSATIRSVELTELPK